MEKFKEKIRKRTIYMSIIILLLGISYFIFMINRNSLPEVPEFITGFQMGIFIALEIILIYLLVRYTASLKNEKSLMKLSIEENDERTKMIKQMTGAMGTSICDIGLTFASVVAGFFNQIVFFTLLGAVVFTLLVKVVLKIYYNLKF